MRLAIICSWYTDIVAGSGTAVFFHALMEGLRSSGHELDLVAPTLTRTDYIGLTLQRFLFNAELRDDPRLQAADAIIGFDYDGYGLDERTSPPLISSALALFGDVLQWETDPIRTMVEAQAFFDEAAMHKARYVTVGSQYAKDRLVALYHLPVEKIVIIPYGSLQPAWMQFYAEFPRVVNDHPILLAVGKMFPRKRQDVLLRALALIRKQYPTVELRLVGDGIEWDRLHTLAAELDVEQAVTWLGSITDDHHMAHEWRQSDLFVHPSSQETFGYAYLEAMQLGKPIVAARAGAAPEVLGDAALLVEPGQPQALAAGISQLLDDDRQRLMYGQRALVQAKRFTIEAMVAGYSQLLKTIIE